jgi:transitional endoplasmic reticulum ATPase
MDNVRATITDEIEDYYERIEDEFTGGATHRDRRQGGRIGFQ